MTGYEGCTPGAAIKAAVSYLYNIWNTNEWILSVRVGMWAKLGAVVTSYLIWKR